MRFYSGQRIKKVRGMYTGHVAVFVCYEERTNTDGVATILSPWVSVVGCQFPAGSDAFIETDQWEPLCKDDDEVGSWDALEELGLDVDTIREAVYFSGAER